MGKSFVDVLNALMVRVKTRRMTPERRNKMHKKEIDNLNDAIKWFKTVRKNNDMACILPDHPMMKNIIKWLEKLREYENGQEKGEKSGRSVLVIDTPESCTQCPLLNGSDECVMQDESANFNADSFDDLIHGCRLKALPKYKTLEKPGEYEYGEMHGWNRCIDEIIGKGKDI